MINGKVLDITEAKEPSNIIWENLHRSNESILLKRNVVFFEIFTLIIVMIILFTLLKQSLNKIVKRYPPTINCNAYNLEKKDVGLATLDKPLTI